jgi:hypothetical protein
MKYVGGTVDFSGWDFGYGNFNDRVCKDVSEVLNEDLKDGESWAGLSLPSLLGERPEEDPLMLTLRLYIASDGFVTDQHNGEVPQFRLSLRDLAKEEIDNCRQGGEAVTEQWVADLIGALRLLADELDEYKGPRPERGCAWVAE